MDQENPEKKIDPNERMYVVMATLINYLGTDAPKERLTAFCAGARTVLSMVRANHSMVNILAKWDVPLTSAQALAINGETIYDFDARITNGVTETFKHTWDTINGVSEKEQDQDTQTKATSPQLAKADEAEESEAVKHLRSIISESGL